MTSILNSSNAPLLAGATFSGTYQKLTTNVECISIVIRANVDGQVKIIFADNPTLPSLYTHTYQYDHTLDFHRVVSKKGLYVKVQYTNGATNQTSFQLKTYLKNDFEVEQTTEGGNDVNVTNEYLVTEVMNDITVTGLTFTPEGALIVSGGIGPTGSGSTEVYGNVGLTGPVEVFGNVGLTGAVGLTGPVEVFGNVGLTGAVGITGPVEVFGNVGLTGAVGITGPVEVFGNVGLTGPVEVFGNVGITGTIETNDAEAKTVLDNIYIATGNTEINTTPIAYSPVHLDLETQGSLVWADSTVDWTAPLNGEQGWQYDNSIIGGANAYFYSNSSLVMGANEPDITLGSLENISFVGNYRLLLDSNPNKKFYISLTTKPLGDGNDYYPGVFRSRKVWELSSATIISKGADFLFYAMTDVTSFRRDLDHKEMALAIQNGPRLGDEVIQFMSINVDSGTTVNQFSGILKEAYFSTAGGTNRQVVFDNSIARKADYNLSQLTVGMGTLQVNMAGFTFNGDDELLVTKQTYVDIRSSGIDLTHTTNGAKECLDVSVDNIVKCDTDAVIISSGSVSVSGDVGLVAGTQVNLLDSTVGLVENTVVGLSAGSQVELINSSVGLTAGAQVEVINSTVSLATGSLVGLAEGSMVGFIADSVVGIAGDSVIGITGSVQTHNFASSNGTDWHHLASDANGRIITLSRTHDGSGNDITSTAVSGTETYRGLDVVCKGAVSVQNVSSTQLAIKAQQYGYYGNLLNNVATILPAGVSSGLDVSAWSYFIGAYEDYYAGMPGTGSLRLQYSFDNTTYYDLFGTTISPGGVGTPRTANIQKQDIPGINWIRFKNDSSVTLASVTITLLGASI